ncbi:hypothetical protein [Mucilaginibacter sp.]|jgi:hypothetical protein|uniref:hypothetical protein n=1 Tax=Mucilaginibacter sp. TaxID=1882438 RepID=UPI0035618A71
MVQQQYIDSGILETYVMGSASDEEVKELMYMKATYPEVCFALQQLEIDMEHIARHMAVTPPVCTWDKISDTIDELMVRPVNDLKKNQTDRADRDFSNFNKGSQYIVVEAESNHIRVHKIWRWILAAIFLLGKIFLGFAIYFYLENKQAKQQLKELKTELRQIKK